MNKQQTNEGTNEPIQKIMYIVNNIIIRSIIKKENYLY